MRTGLSASWNEMAMYNCYAKRNMMDFENRINPNSKKMTNDELADCIKAGGGDDWWKAFDPKEGSWLLDDGICETKAFQALSREARRLIRCY